MKKETPEPVLFPPGPVEIGRLASARLVGVTRRPGHFVGRYQLTPKDNAEFVDIVSRLKGEIGHRYPVLPGTWATFMVPEEVDEVELHVGLEQDYGRAMHAARKTLKVQGTSVLSELSVRMAALGYLRYAGVTRWSVP